MNIAMTIPLVLIGLLMLSITSPTDQAIAACHIDPTGKTQEIPGVMRFPKPVDYESIPPEFRALVGTEYTHPKDHQYPTVRFCPGSVLVINRTSPLSPFQNHPFRMEQPATNEVREFLGYAYISAELSLDPIPRIPKQGIVDQCWRGPPKVNYLPNPDVRVHNNIFEDYQIEKLSKTSSLKT